MKQKKTTLNFKDKEEALNQIKKWSRERKSLEICGFLGFKDGQYVSLLCDNISEQPSRYFAIDPVEYLNFKYQNEIICVFHSHINGDEEPSEFDVSMSENCCLPFMIYSLNTDRFCLYKPKSSDAEEELVKEIQKII
jgi:proteasome lid subunit RPN8/RPN11